MGGKKGPLITSKTSGGKRGKKEKPGGRDPIRNTTPGEREKIGRREYVAGHPQK